MEHIISIDQINKEKLAGIFDSADEMRRKDNGTYLDRKNLASRYIGRQMVSLFYEPSTRTRLSFELAGAKLGMGVVSTENAREFSSNAKGETLEDTIRVLNEYHFDTLVMRHHETGAAKRAAEVATMPILNAGDGKGEHPTQAILDAYTINEYFDGMDNLNIVIGGDLKNGRTARSLARLAALYSGNKITFVSTPEFQMDDDVKQYLDSKNIFHKETDDMNHAVKDADVVYWTRLQKERIEGAIVQDQQFVIDRSVLDNMWQDTIIMHPLPRVGEITTDVDDDQRARYFRQAGNGLYVRMALLDHILEQ